MQIHDIRLWHIYICPKCNQSQDPKTKFVVVVGKKNNTVLGFFISTNPPRLFRSNPLISVAQVEIDKSECEKLLDRTSYISCNDLKVFFAWELSKRYCEVRDTTKDAIIIASEASKRHDAETLQIIKNNRDKS